MSQCLLCEVVELGAGREGSQLKLQRVCSCYGTMLKVNWAPLTFEIRYHIRYYL